MHRLVLAAAAALTLAAATGCEARYHGPPGYADVYYDGYYGPFAGGYWGDDGFFYYSNGHGGFDRDEGRHFHHRAFEHGQHFHADARPHHDDGH